MNFVFALFSNTSRFGQDGGYQSIGDVLKNGGSYAIVGLLTVFSVLAIIWGLLELFHIVCHGRKPKKKNNVPTPDSPAAPSPAAVTDEQTASVSLQNQEDEEIVAVIAAAIAAAQSEHPLGSFRVVSFKRK